MGYYKNKTFSKQGDSLSEKEAVVYHRNQKLKRTCAIVLVILLGVTFVGHQFATSILGPYSIMKGTTFEDYDSFVEYMEQDIPASPKHSFNGGMTAVEIPVSSEEIGTSTYYDEYGNEISEEEALTRRLEDKNAMWFANILTATNMWFRFDALPRMELFSPSPFAQRMICRKLGKPLLSVM